MISLITAVAIASVNPYDAKSIQSLEGQWTGQIEVRNDRGVSASVVTASNQLSDDGSALLSYFEGYAFGRPIDSAFMWEMDSARAGECTWYDLTARQSATANLSFENNSFVASGQNPLPGHGNFVQVTQVVNNNRYTAEWFSVNPDGTRTSVIKLTMSRMAPGRFAAAHSNANFQPAFSRLSRNFQNIATAQAND